MRKIIRSVTLFTVVLGLTACGGGSENTTAEANTDDGNLITVANGSGGIERFNKTTAGPDIFVTIEQSDEDPLAFPGLSSIPTLDVDRVAINDTVLVITDKGDSKLKVVEPNSFTELGSLDNINTVLTLNFASDTTLYIDTVGQGLRQISLSDPANPIQLRRMSTFYTAYESFIRGTILFQAIGLDGLEIWNIEDANRPTLKSQLIFKDEANSEDEPALPLQARALATIDENTLLVAARAGGVFVIDVSDLDAPLILDRYYPKDTQIWDIAVAGDHAYLAAGNQIHVLDISDPGNIIPLVGIEHPGFVQNVNVNDGYVVFALAEAGVLLHRLMDDPKTNYTLIPMPDGLIAQEVVYQSDAVYVAAETQLLKLYK